MEVEKKRNIKSGAQYDHFFPRANVDDQTVLKNAGVGDTVSFIPKVVGKTLGHTKGIAAALKGRNDYETCRNIWQFVYDHIAYRKDKDGYEQIRSPARAWHDRKEGVDCDCYTTFISSILSNLGIKHKLRITKYSRDYFQHIYPVALLPRPVILDCVTDQFDFEVPYSEKKDYAMELQYLNGLDGTSGMNSNNTLFDGTDGMEELGKLFKKKAKSNNSGGGSKKKGGGIFKKVGQKLKKVNLKKVLNVVNKVNPATVALRNGVLASMKINVGNVSRRLRWAYLSPDQARAKGMDMNKWQKLVEVRQKLEKIFYGAGGKTENLKKAILHGKGNKDNAVHGLDGLGVINYGYHPESPYHPLNRINKRTPLRQLLGDDMFFSENSVGTLGELGEPVSMAMIAAASGVIAAIASSIKKIGDLFGGKGKGSKDFDEGVNKEAEKEIPEGGNEAGDKAADQPSGSSSENPSSGGESSGGTSLAKSKRFDDSGSDAGGSTASEDDSGSKGGGDNSGGGSGSSAGEEEGTNGNVASKALAKKDADSSGDDKESMWEKNKKWMVPVGVGVLGIGIIAVVASATKAKPAPAAAKPMHGLPAKKKEYKRKTKKAKGGKTAKKGKAQKGKAVPVRVS